MRWDTCHAEGCDRAILPGSDRNMCPWCRGVFAEEATESTKAASR